MQPQAILIPFVEINFSFMFLQLFSDVDWKQFLLGKEQWGLLLETAIRTILMFVVVLVGIRVLGKRGVKQLSIFELVVIISLGSAAGDPMFYNDVGILIAIIVFIMVVLSYKLVCLLMVKSKPFEDLIEGKPVYLIKHGVFLINNFNKETLTDDEFFSELRLKGISQLGQVEIAIQESSGDISIFPFEDSQVKYGLPILPDTYNEALTEIIKTDLYSCSFCGYTEEIKAPSSYTCPTCKRNQWIKSVNSKRVT
jgi:uncharacterized membrane protein YcaP (DUF421 family)